MTLTCRVAAFSASVRAAALQMAAGDRSAPVLGPSDIEATAKAPPSETAVLKTESGKGALATGGGLAVTAGGGIAQFANLDTVGEQAERVGSTASSVSYAGDAMRGVFGLDFRILLIMGVIIAVCGLAYLLFQLTRTQREKA